MTLSRTGPRAKQRWTLLGAVVLALTLIGAIAAQAQVDNTLFELDKDATNNNLSEKIGVLNAAVSAGTTSPISLQICQASTTAWDGALILIDAERMTLGTGTSASGGGCPSGFSNKFNYTGVTRIVQPDTNTGHSKGENVTRLVSGDDTSMPGNDWDQVYEALTEGPIDDKCLTLGAVECTWTADGRATSIFTSSKDYAEIDTWQWRDQSVPDANELDHGFAVKYVDGDDEQHLFFGADRFATEGAKDAGFWFFKADVGPIPPVGNADGTFTGLHTAPVDGENDGFCNPAEGGLGGPSDTPNCQRYDDNDSGGDILILTTFTNGGAVTTIRVFEWIGPAGSTAALLERGTAGDCVPFPSPAPFMCATVNDTTIESPWDYSGKNEPAINQIAAGGFLEGGINLTDLGLEGCFSSFMATTRSSPSLTADPKDFILGSFEACDASLTTTPKGGSGLSTPLTADTDGDNLDEITIGTNGRVEVTDSAVLDVQGTTNFEGDLNFFLCGPIANPAGCDDTGLEVGAAAGVNPVTANGTYVSAVATITEVGRYCWYATFESETPGLEDGTDDGTVESELGTGECFEVMPVAPTLSTQASNPTLSTAALFGTAIDDNAFLAGTARQPQDGGPHATYDTIHLVPPVELGDPANNTITFRLYGPSATPSCVDGAEGNLIGSSVVNVSGDAPPAEYKASDGTITGTLTPPSPGIYWWTASYSGDSPNTLPAPKDSSNAATFTPCGDTNESSVVAQIPTSIQTAQWIYPNDDATISAAAGGELTGSVQFRLFDTLANCQANTTDGTIGDDGLLYEKTVTVPNDNPANATTGADSETVGTDNTGTKVSSSTTVYWRVLFTSTNSAQESRLSNCTENTQVTFTGNNTGSGIKP